jgi:hypothetical protein
MMNPQEREALLGQLNALGPVPAERDTGYDQYCEGQLARHRDQDFDAHQSRPWKLGWLDADQFHDEQAAALVFRQTSRALDDIAEMFVRQDESCTIKPMKRSIYISVGTD